MTVSSYDFLFSSGRIGRMELRNRIVMSTMGTGYASATGEVTERTIAYFTARASGGAGLIMADTATIVTLHNTTCGPLDIANDNSIPGLTRLVAAVHSGGAKIGVQLWHPGRQVSILSGDLPAVAPSAIPCPVCRVMPRMLSVPDIEELIELYAQAAIRAAAAGFDLVEIHAAHGYLAGQFLSPTANVREDAYGGSLAGRARFLLEIVRQVRRRLGTDFPISCRINGADNFPGGVTIEDSQVYASLLQEAGVDALSVSGGMYGSYPSIVPPVMDPPGCYAELAARVRSVVQVPVIAAGRINTPDVAESILREGKADFVAMGRALLADPALPNKARAGKEEEICFCVGCNKLCVDIITTGTETAVGCMVNPVAGKEFTATPEVVTDSKRVLVVGGGLAGMKAAQTAALRGHQVILCEQESMLGGQFRLAALPPGKGEFLRAIQYLEHSLVQSGVDLRLGVVVDSDLIKKIEPDVVIVATGSNPVIPHIPGIKEPHVVPALTALKGNCEIGKRVVVIGGGGVGLETALYLADKGHQVTVIELTPQIGKDMGPIFRMYVREELAASGVAILTATRVVAIGAQDLLVARKDGSAEQILMDTVIYAVGATANKQLASALGGRCNFHLIGDARQPCSAVEAIREGWEIGRQL